MGNYGSVAKGRASRCFRMPLAESELAASRHSAKNFAIYGEEYTDFVTLMDVRVVLLYFTLFLEADPKLVPPWA